MDEAGNNNALEEGTDEEVWKICTHGETRVYVRLLVPKLAKRVTPVQVVGTNEVCESRVEYATVIDITDLDGFWCQPNGKEFTKCESFIRKKLANSATSSLVYVKGQTIRVDNFNSSADQQSGEGIYVCKQKEHCLNWLKMTKY